MNCCCDLFASDQLIAAVDPFSVSIVSHPSSEASKTQIVVVDGEIPFFFFLLLLLYFYICNNFAIFSFYCPVLKIEGFALFFCFKCRVVGEKKESERRKKKLKKIYFLFDKQIVDYF